MNVCVLLSLAVYFVFRRQFHYTWICECDKYVRTYPFIKSATKVVFRIGYILNTRDHDHEKRPYTYTILFIRQSFSSVPWMVMKMQFLLVLSQCFWCICRSMILMHNSLTLIIVEYNILCLAWLAHDKTGCVYQKYFTMVWWED